MKKEMKKMSFLLYFIIVLPTTPAHNHLTPAVINTITITCLFVQIALKGDFSLFLDCSRIITSIKAKVFISTSNLITLLFLYSLPKTTHSHSYIQQWLPQLVSIWGKCDTHATHSLLCAHKKNRRFRFLFAAQPTRASASSSTAR